MKLLVENPDNGYRLFYDPDRVNRYAVYKTVSMGLSNDLMLPTMVAQSSIFSPKIQSYFTKQQCNTARAKVHAIQYTSHRFKS